MLTSLAQSAFSTWLLGSESIWGYPTVLTLHTLGMMVLSGAALVIDLRLLRFAPDIPLPAMRRLFGVLWGAFVLNAVTGSMLFVAAADVRGVQPLFWAKLALVVLGLVTTEMIRRGHFRGGEEPVAVTTRARGLALVSVFSWIAAITAGRFLAYIA